MGRGSCKLGLLHNQPRPKVTILPNVRINGKQFDLLSEAVNEHKLQLEVSLDSYPLFADFCSHESIAVELDNDGGTRKFGGTVSMLLRQSDRLYVEVQIAEQDRQLEVASTNKTSAG